MKTKTIAELGLLTALAVIFGWVEHMIPLVPSIPGIKLGLGNIVVMLALYRFGKREAVIVSCAKVLLSALIFGSFSGLIYSASGAVCSFAVMCLTYKQKAFSSIGVSVAGGSVHICAQVGVAVLITATPQLWRLIPPLLLAGVLTGALNGYLVEILINKLPKVIKN